MILIQVEFMLFIYYNTFLNIQLTLSDVLNIITKFSYLVFIAVITTSLYVVMSILGFGTFIAVDCWVNLICLLLMSKKNKKYYNFICNKCHKRLYSIMYHIIDTRKSKNQTTSQV